MVDTTRLLLPYIAPSQSQKHVTHNEALRFLDGLVQMSVVRRDLTAPPGSPNAGDCYIVAAGGTGVWDSWDDDVAMYADGAWYRLVALEGMRAWDQTAGEIVIHVGGSWAEVSSVLTLQNLDLVGINATADTTDRLAVKSTSALFDNVGAGHQIKVNKAAAGDTASLLFQTGYSGRAEFGTTGDDDFHVKVSPDGSSWTESMVINQTTGLITGAAVQSSLSDTTLGRLMTVGAFGLGYDANAPLISDFTTALVPGFYRYLEASATNAPGDGSSYHGGALVLRSVSGFPLVFAGRTTGDATKVRMFVGSRAASTGTINWQELYGRNNVLGTVSQAAGVPTGAVMESGSSANGEYLRLAGGTQICWHTLTANSGAATAWAFPAVFSVAPRVLGSATATVLSCVCQDAAPTTTAASFSARDKTDARRADTVRIMAIGRWF